MALRIIFELSANDLKHFQLIMAEARSAAARFSPEHVIKAAGELLAEVRTARVPDFIQKRLEVLELLTRMLTDEHWRLPEAEAARVLNALSYFCEAEDLIPDHIPGLGFLDDAIMMELVARELKHEIDAYRDFCDFRAAELKRRKRDGGADVTREDWLRMRRQELQSRMRRRHKSDSERAKKLTRPPLALF